MRICDGVIYYNIRQQDDRLIEMTVADTREMRLFVAWVEKHDGHENIVGPDTTNPPPTPRAQHE